ncbi:AsmA family protein [Rhodovibrionaceae bacterium A322]
MTIKRILWGLVALVAAVIVAGAAIIMSLDKDMIRERIQAEVKDATGRDIQVKGDLDIALSLNPSVVLNDVVFPNAEWGSRPDLATIKRFEVGVALIPLLSREVVLRKVVMDGADILVEISKDGKANWDFSADPAPASGSAEGTTSTTANQSDSSAPAGDSGTERGGLGVIVEFIEIRDSRLQILDGVTSTDLRLQLEKADFTRNGDILDVDLVGDYQDTPFTLKGQMGTFQRMLTASPFLVNLNGSVGELVLSADGAITDVLGEGALNMALTADGPNLKSLEKLAGSDLPGFGPLAFSGTVKSSGTTYELAGFKASVDDSELTGDLSIALGGERPKISGKLASKQLEIADFEDKKGGGDSQGAGSSGAEGATASQSEYVFTDDPLPLDGLKAVDADLDLQIKQLLIDEQLSAENLAAKIQLTNGRLEMKDLGGNWFKGQLKGSTVVDASKSPAALKVDLNFDGFDYGEMLKSRDISDDVQGTLDVDVNLTAQGNSQRAIMSSLTGNSDIVGHKGMISNKLIAIVSADLNNIMNPLMGKKDQVPLNCLASRFVFKDGLATSKAQVFDTETFAVAGDGTIDFRTEKLKMGFDVKTRVQALVSLAVPFLVQGTLKSPTVLPDPVGTALFAAKVFATGSNPLTFLGATVVEDTVLSEGNPCVAALEKAESGAPAPKQNEGLPAKTLQGTEKAIEGVTEGVGKTLKGLFGD